MTITELQFYLMQALTFALAGSTILVFRVWMRALEDRWKLYQHVHDCEKIVSELRQKRSYISDYELEKLKKTTEEFSDLANHQQRMDWLGKEVNAVRIDNQKLRAQLEFLMRGPEDK